MINQNQIELGGNTQRINAKHRAAERAARQALKYAIAGANNLVGAMENALAELNHLDTEKELHYLISQKAYDSELEWRKDILDNRLEG